MSRKDEIKQMIQNLIVSHLGATGYSLFIFGSQANSSSLKRSDIDVGIEPQDHFEIPNSLLHKLKEELNNLPTLYWFDLVDFKKVDTTFYNLSKRNIELL
jgi:predicted nucleotidyltransferase